LGKKGIQDPAIGYAWAASLAKLGELPQASGVLAEFAKEDRPAETLMLVGQLWIEIEDYEKAVRAFHDALQKDPTLPKAHYFAGQACIRWQHWEEAAKEFQAELALVPGTRRRATIWDDLQQSRVPDAAKLFQEVIAERPEHANAQYEYGKVLLDRGELQQAIAHLEIAAQLSPQTDYVHYQLQSAYRKDGRIREADHELEVYKRIKAKKCDRASISLAPQKP
jgi:tetratricopeptide (TPR) repeat protein